MPHCNHAVSARSLMSARKFPDVLRIFPLGARLIAQGLISAYRLTLSPFIGLDCRHLPTCSAYAAEAIGRFGLWAGGWMTLARLCRCQPFGTSGLDFVPASLPRHSRWYLPWRYGLWRGTNPGPGE
jgi:putative membrane protein insertion efficiency factor